MKKVSRRKDSQERSIKFIFLLAAIGLLVVAGVFWSNQYSRSNITSGSAEEKSNHLVLETKAHEIAAHFVCACGDCEGESLELCTCGRAVQERREIRSYLEQGKSADRIIDLIASIYGGLKPLAGSSDKTLPNQIEKDQLPLIKGKEDGNFRLDTKLATMTDRNEILSHFYCSCGKCGKDDLKDCDCSHPGGAKEIKAFVDKKINEKTYTVDQLISEIENIYGGKKL